jgi:hypothetical protein
MYLSAVFPDGPQVIRGQELGGEYFEKAGPVIEAQVAKAGYRMAAWLDRIAADYEETQEWELVDWEPMDDEL